MTSLPHENASSAQSGIPVDILMDRKMNSTLGPFGHHHLGGGGGSAFGHVLQFTVISSLLLVCFLAVIVVGVCIIKRRSLKCISPHNRMEMKSRMSSMGPGRLLPEAYLGKPMYETTCLDLSIRMYTSDEVTLLAQIGQGCFGKVFKGELGGEVVAVKQVRSEHSTEAMREIEAMASFSHPNILPLYGIAKSEEEDAPWLLFEYMKHGDLASVLRQNSPRLAAAGGSVVTLAKKVDAQQKDDKDGVLENNDEEESHFQLTHESLSNIAMQIAEGMKYLSSQHFVHRDLAARNCLVSEKGVVKISDFGLSRDVYTCDYYKVGGSKLLPIRWMAPESILYGCFTLESDIWAYGTVLWEIYTWGRQPYFGHSNEEVVQLILDGVLLCPPSDCPPLIQEMMAGCWKTEARDRLTFRQICNRFAKSTTRAAHPDFGVDITKSGHTTVSMCRMEEFEKTTESCYESEYEIPKLASHAEYLQVV
ncbi:Tyrosine-protein kinase transmembrane receptor Ror [Orchesella cincta]|uniref:Tyrosine-protein kinase transmembrane receptor Ror n=1 Tax=Orchesella cincta TaxID=48709 RepID=A0A1D2NH35_ORCCI|nr:Tyrosine-protein kinase transmembrane receptor Ror [Orchesella cincta]